MKFVLGTINLGTELDLNDSFKLLDAAVERGIDRVDTADIYGRRPGEGWTEQLLGRWLSARPGLRDHLRVATKLYLPFSTDPNDRGLGAWHLRLGVDAALARLRVERLDYLLLHHYDDDTPLDETYGELAALQRDGKVAELGTCNHSAWQLGHAVSAARAAGASQPMVEQSPYNLLNRGVEADLLAAAGALQIEFWAWSPLARGILAGMRRRQARGDNAGRLAVPGVVTWLQNNADSITAYEMLCEHWGLSPPRVAMSWLAARGVDAAVIGPRSLAQLTELTEAPLVMTPEQLGELDAIFPGGVRRDGPPHH